MAKTKRTPASGRSQVAARAEGQSHPARTARAARIDPGAAQARAAARRALAALPSVDPGLSARRPAGRGLAVGCAALAIATLAGVFPTDEASALAGAAMLLPAIVFAVLGLMRAVFAGLPGPAAFSAPPVAPDLAPRWSVIIALHREDRMVAGLLEALARLDWPADRLDIIVACEAHDRETIAALNASRRLHAFRLLVLPPLGPMTKPRALQAALGFARGRFISVFDAEDRPDPAQLRAAFHAFATGPANLAVVQAPLVAHNLDESWIAAQFALDYAVWFRVVLPGLARLSPMLPLGGTSNHFRARALRQAGGWDPWNVTEDADLGIRLARLGWRAGLISPPTFEEAPPRADQWVRQRGRWIQGHLITLGVHLRRPGRLARELGPRGLAALALTGVLGPLGSALQGPFLLGTMIALATGAPFGLQALAAAGAIASGFAAIVAVRRDGRWPLALHILTLPVYHALQSAAFGLALVRLFRAPHVWCKTDHGAAARARPARANFDQCGSL